MMPLMDGVHAGQAIHKMKPDTYIVMATGSPELEQGPRVDEDYTGPLLRKPFTAEQLLRRVRRVLDAQDIE